MNIADNWQAIIKALPDLVFILSESGKYHAILGGENSEQYHDASSLINLSVYDVLPKHKADWFVDRIRETLDLNRLMVFEYSLAASDVDSVEEATGPEGELRFEGRVSPISTLSHGERAVVWVARNITDRHRLEQQLVQQAELDPLSKAYNRRKLFNELRVSFTKYQRYKQNISLILINIDDFKKVNDRFGQQVGDRVICHLVRVCQLQLKEFDLFGRIGGDEFGIIYKGRQEAALAFSHTLRELVTAMESEPVVSISVGVSQFQPKDNSIDDLYHRADVALYQSKRAGKNRSTVI